MGLELEARNRRVLEDLRTADASEWTADDLAVITAQPVAQSVRGLPEKHAYGSDFPFHDAGQLHGMSTDTNVHRAVISAAYGGFSNTWGAQITPFTSAALALWPARSRPTEADYRAILSEIPFAAEHDDLDALLPLFASPSPLPPPSARTALVLDAYNRHRPALHRLGVTLGRARLAFDAPNCVRCGLCMTGCPYSLIYSSSHTFDALRRTGRVKYHGGLMAVEVGEHGDQAFVQAKDMQSGRVCRFEADRVFVACGAIGTTRLAMQSLQRFDEPVAVQEPAQFIIPFISGRPTPDPKTEPQFTLNQFNMVVALDDAGRDISQLHFYTYNPAFIDALPRVLHSRYAAPVVDQLLRRLCVTVGYLPSWVSPRMHVTAHAPRRGEEISEIVLSRDNPHWHRNVMLRKVLTRIAGGPAPRPLAASADDAARRRRQELPLGRQLPAQRSAAVVGHERRAGTRRTVAARAPDRRSRVPERRRNHVHAHDHGERASDRERDARIVRRDAVSDGRTVAITGAYGYLGALIRRTLDADGWHTHALVPRRGPMIGRPSASTSPRKRRRLRCSRSTCSCTARTTRRSCARPISSGSMSKGPAASSSAAHDAEVRRLIVVSSMSAYPGTTQVYGRAKLAIEAAAQEIGGYCVRPGVVYGEQSRGMAGALRKLTALPVVPVVADKYKQYLVHEHDLASAISALAGAPDVGPEAISVAHPTPVSMRAFLTGLAAAEGRRCRFLPVPWRAVYAGLRAGELAGVRLAFRADSLLGLVRPAPGLVGTDALTRLGVRVRPFAPAPGPHA